MDVLDLGAGKGGDFSKYSSARVNHVEHVDIAHQSLVDASKRYQRGHTTFTLDLVCADFTNCRLIEHLPIPPHSKQFDVCVSMFAAHYAFASKDSARCFFQNCTDRLIEGGAIIMIVADGDWILYVFFIYPPLSTKKMVKLFFLCGDIDNRRRASDHLETRCFESNSLKPSPKAPSLCLGPSISSLLWIASTTSLSMLLPARRCFSWQRTLGSTFARQTTSHRMSNYIIKHPLQKQWEPNVIRFRLTKKKSWVRFFFFSFCSCTYVDSLI